MSRTPRLLAVTASFFLCSPPALAGGWPLNSAGGWPQDVATPAPAAEVLADVRVHGNHSTPDSGILSLAGVSIGAPLPADVVDTVQRRLRVTSRFTSVEVRKRYRSLTDTSAVVLVIIVSEPARGADELPRIVTPMSRFRDGLMFMPLLTYADGYGFTFGGRATFADVLGKRGRLTVPLTWGGVRRAAIEGEKRFTRGPFTRVEAMASISQRENPHYELADRRFELGARAERAITSSLRVGGGVGWTDVSFGGPASGGAAPAFDLDDRFVSFGGDVTFDTRRDPTFPRNAIYLNAGWEGLRFDSGSTIGRVRTEARGYVGLFGSSVLSLRARYWQADAPLPAYEQWMLGGASTLRGYGAGTYVGDKLFATSAELRMPLTSPLKVGRTGFTVFVDSGAVAPHGARLRDQRMHSGAGVGVFLIATVLQLNLDVAKGFDGGTRVHLMTGFSF
jgi:outer membrane protein assembly factor BamA